MGATSGIVFDSIDNVRAPFPTIKVNSPNPPFGTTASVSDSNLSCGVSAAFAVAPLGEREREERPAFPKMIVDGPLQMTDTRRAGFVCPHSDRILRIGRRAGIRRSVLADDRVARLAFTSARGLTSYISRRELS